MNLLARKLRRWCREQWLIAVVLGGLALLALILLVLDAARRPADSESRFGTVKSVKPSSP
jgi:hypothetical protein